MTKQKATQEKKKQEITLERSIGGISYLQPNWHGSSNLVIEFGKPTVFRNKNLSKLLESLKKWEEDAYRWNFCDPLTEPRYTYYQVKIYNPEGKLTNSQICSSPANEAWDLTRFDEAKARSY